MGIICIETEWEHTVESSQSSLHTKALLEFFEKSYKCDVIYRRVATRQELRYYLKRFSLKPYKEKYSILYFSFHGNTHSIILEGEKNKEMTLDELADMANEANNCFSKRTVHFSSCRTFIGSEKYIEDFKSKTGALFVSGYTTTVDSVLSAIHDIAYFDQIFRHQVKTALTASAMERYYKGLGDKLGFKMF